MVTSGNILRLARRGCDCMLHSRTPASPICRETGLAFTQEDLVESRRALAEITPQTVYLFARPVSQEAGVLLDFAQNIQWLLQEWADRGNLRRIVFASTQLVYATPQDDTPLPVNSLLFLKTPYDCHKAEMEFYLSLLAHHPSGVKAEILRLPLLAGRLPAPDQLAHRFLFQWRADYLAGRRWEFPANNPKHKTWGNSWVHVDDLVQFMIARQDSRKRLEILQPVTGHLRYVEMDAFFRARYSPPPMKEPLHLPKTCFYLQDNANMPRRPIEDAFPEPAEGRG